MPMPSLTSGVSVGRTATSGSSLESWSTPGLTESFRIRASERVGDTTVATVDGAVAGFVMVVDDEVEQVYVSALHRGTGVAAVLMDEAERQVRANGHGKAWLAVVAGNARARAFYERAGWCDEGPFEYAAASEGGPIAVPCHRYTKLLQSYR